MWQRLTMSPERYREKVKQNEQKLSENDQLKEELKYLSMIRG